MRILSVYSSPTGCNEAFIISTEKRDEILANCRDEEERKRTEELIRPILRGRDIRRYSYDWANLWLINTHNGVRGKIDRIHIEDYPAVKAHLDQYWDKIKDRTDQGETPYNLRNCAYLEDFFKPKIVWSRLMRLSKTEPENFPRFAFVENNLVTADSCCFITGENILQICNFLNSTFAAYFFFKNVAILDNGGMQMRQQYIEEIYLPGLPYLCGDDDIYDGFNFTKEERQHIEMFVAQTKSLIRT